MSENEKKLPEELEEYEPQIIDLDGEQFEIIDGICYDGTNYVALVPFTEEEDDSEEGSFIILKEVEEKGECGLETVDKEELYDEVGQAFIEHFNEIFGDECCCDDDDCCCDCH